MPLTLSHPAAVIPLRRLGLPMSTLVFGSMVLDVPLYLGSRRGYEMTHSLPGVVTIDIVLTLLVLVVWFGVMRDPLVDLSPSVIRSRLAPRARLTRRQWLLAIPAASIAAFTHVAWDSFTHPDRWGAEHAGWVQADHLGLAGFKWAQYVSGVLGLMVVCAWALIELRSLPADKPRQSRALGSYALVGAIGIAGAVGVATAIAKVPSGFHSMAFHGVINSIITVVLTVGFVSVAWHRAVREPAGTSRRQA
jgi:hypothetical protein